MIVVVQQAFRLGNRDVVAGEVLDGTGWPNLEAMVRQRLVKKASKDEAASYTPPKKPSVKKKLKLKIKRA